MGPPCGIPIQVGSSERTNSPVPSVPEEAMCLKSLLRGITDIKATLHQQCMAATYRDGETIKHREELRAEFEVIKNSTANIVERQNILEQEVKGSCSKLESEVVSLKNRMKALEEGGGIARRIRAGQEHAACRGPSVRPKRVESNDQSKCELDLGGG